MEHGLKWKPQKLLREAMGLIVVCCLLSEGSLSHYLFALWGKKETLEQCFTVLSFTNGPVEPCGVFFCILYYHWAVHPSELRFSLWGVGLGSKRAMFSLDLIFISWVLDLWTWKIKAEFLCKGSISLAKGSLETHTGPAEKNTVDHPLQNWPSGAGPKLCLVLEFLHTHLM